MKLLRTRWLSRAGKALEADDIETAEAIVKRQLERKPDDLDALHLLGRIHSFMEQYEAAQEIYERLLKMDNTDEEARERLRRTHLRQAFNAREAGETEEMERAYRAALEIDPEDAFTHYNLGCAYMDGPPNRADKAAASWLRAIELRPDYVEAHFDLAQLYFADGRYEAARPYFEAAAEARPDWPAPIYCLAVIAVKTGDLEKGLEYALSAADLNTGWGRTAAEDENLAPLRGNPAFDELANLASGPLDVLSREDILRGSELFEEMDDAEE